MIIRCCIDAQPEFVPKARYAIRMLLLPLGLEVSWVSQDDLGPNDLYYGARSRALPSGALMLPLSKQAEDHYAAKMPFPAGAVCWRDGWPVLFPGSAPHEDDLIASTFYWLSGWQEHVLRRRDHHGRFMHKDSLQYALQITTRPVVDAHRHSLHSTLVRHGIAVQERTWRGKPWAVCPTIDVDYLKKWRKGMVYREVVEYLLANRRRVRPSLRLARFGRFLRDALRPGDVYQQALERMYSHIRSVGTGTVFLKMAAHGPNDVAYRQTGPFLGQTVKKLRQAQFEIGLHPSYHAHTHPRLLVAERDRLEALTGEVPRSVRQHFLRYEAPATPRIQEQAGFHIDSTLAFAEHEGFRNGTCLPFQRYDAEANRATAVWEMPLAIMESTLFNRRGLCAKRAVDATRSLLDTCRHFGGVAVLLWHNVLWDEMDHPGWGTHFVETLAMVQQRGAQVASLQQALHAWLNGKNPTDPV